MDKKISIIVPVFNVEKYLERCVDSLVNQTYQNIEIILVDDCSPDKSGEICEALAKNDSRIKVVHKEINEGLGFARNTGIENATGDYIILVDSDDYLDLNTCAIAKSALEENGADVCCYMWADVFKNNIHRNALIETPLVFEGEQIACEFLANSLAPEETEASGEFGISSCMALYSSSLFADGKLRFVSEREYLNEDMLFRTELCKHISKAVIIPDILYCYFHNSGTLTTRYQQNRFEKSVKMFNKMNESCAVFGCNELFKRNVRYFMINTLVSIKQEVDAKGCASIGIIRDICNNETLISAVSSYPVDAMPSQQKLFFNLIKKNKPISVYALTKVKLLSERKTLS